MSDTRVPRHDEERFCPKCGERLVWCRTRTGWGWVHWVKHRAECVAQPTEGDDESLYDALGEEGRSVIHRLMAPLSEGDDE